MKQRSKLRHAEEQGTQASEQAQKISGAKEFSSVEEMLRFDAAQNPPPPSLAQRINESIGKEPPKPSSWWQRLRGLFLKS